MTARKMTAVGGGVLVVLGTITQVVGQLAGLIDGDLEFGAISVVTLVIGLLITFKRPENRMGLLLIGISVLGTLTSLADSFSTEASAVGDYATAAWMELLSEAAFTMLFVGVFILLPLWFPTGQVVSRGWHWLQATAIALAAGVLTLLAVAETRCIRLEDADQCAAIVRNPIGIRGVSESIGELLLLGIFLLTLPGAYSAVVRFRRSRGDERIQLKWFVLAVILVTLAFLSQFLVPWPELVMAAAFMTLPVAVGVAILRYRLYEIDRVISRTVGYGLVVGLLAMFYGLVVVGIPILLPRVEDSQLLVATATLAAFFLFNPLRKRVFRAVDRRFYRSRYDAERIVEEFAARLRNEVDLDELTADWVGVVQETVQPASVSVWVREP